MKGQKGKAPAGMFYFGDWLRDTELQMCSCSTRGIWINLICYMWFAKDRGELEGTPEEFMKLTGASANEIDLFFKEAKRFSFCDISTGSHNIVTLINRRMSREDKEKRKARDRKRKQRERDAGKNHVTADVTAYVTEKSHPPFPSPIPIAKNKEVIKDITSSSTEPEKDPAPSPPICPHKEIIALYHKILPAHRKVLVWSDQRKGFLKARWGEDPRRQSLDWWNKYFHRVRTSDLLCGKSNSGWMPDLEWLVRPNNFAKVIEGKFDSNGKPTDESEADKKLAKWRQGIK